jgi:hypothetical protein
VFLRIVVPFFILFDPFVVPIVLFFLDGLDYVPITSSKWLPKAKYQLLDKVLDFYYLFFMFLMSIYWGNVLLMGLFIYRAVGFFLVLVTKERKIFLFFPNFFEPFYNLYSFGYIYSSLFLTTLDEKFIWFAIGVFIYKMLNEFYVHFFNNDSVLYNLKIVKKLD